MTRLASSNVETLRWRDGKAPMNNQRLSLSRLNEILRCPTIGVL